MLLRHWEKRVVCIAAIPHVPAFPCIPATPIDGWWYCSHETAEFPTTPNLFFPLPQMWQGVSLVLPRKRKDT